MAACTVLPRSTFSDIAFQLAKSYPRRIMTEMDLAVVLTHVAVSFQRMNLKCEALFTFGISGPASGVSTAGLSYTVNISSRTVAS